MESFNRVIFKGVTVVEIKAQLQNLPNAELDEVAATILQLRRARDPHRRETLARLIDGDDWVRWNPPATDQ